MEKQTPIKPEQPKVAVLIHGCHLEAKNWQNIVWGNPRGARGRIPKGIAQALLHDAALIFWGTGASQKDGLKESEYTFKYALGRLAEVTWGTNKSTAEIAEYLKAVSYIDTVTENTTEEIKAALALCHKRGINELILVSSPTHIARAHQEALKVLGDGTFHKVLVYATASDTCFEDSTPADVVIVEPPHRGDMPKWQTYRYARAIFTIMRQGDEKFRQFLHDLGSLLGRYDVKVDWDPESPK